MLPFAFTAWLRLRCGPKATHISMVSRLSLREFSGEPRVYKSGRRPHIWPPRNPITQSYDSSSPRPQFPPVTTLTDLQDNTIMSSPNDVPGEILVSISMKAEDIPRISIYLPAWRQEYHFNGPFEWRPLEWSDLIPFILCSAVTAVSVVIVYIGIRLCKKHLQ